MDPTFGTLLWSMVGLFFWFAVIAMFVYTFVDIVRRDLSRWAKAGWIALIVVLPFLGALAYLIVRPEAPERAAPPAGSFPPGRRSMGSAPADEIAMAARLHEAGRITAVEYDILKRQALRP